MINNSNYKYIIDTSAILSQKDNEPHKRKIYRSKWGKIDDLIREKKIVTCSEIASEVEDDEINVWMKDLNMEIIPIDNDIQENVKKVVSAHKDLVDFKSNKSSGDVFLIATAMKYNLTVITEENKNSSKKIPSACRTLGINCININDLCEIEHWVF